MDPTPQSSFIPKRALAAERGGSIGLFLVLALFIFVVSLLAAGAVFGYQYVLQGQLADKDASLVREEGAFDPATIQDLSRLDSRINQSRTLLAKHVSPSAIFAFLSTITLESVQLTSLDYTLSADGSAMLTVSGVAGNYSSVALQSDQFGASKVLHNVIFSGVTADSAGKVTFNVSATLDPSYILYSGNLSPPQSQPQ